MSSDRSLHLRDATLIALLVVVSLGAPLLGLDRDRLGALLSDDAYYYAQVARNVAHGAGFTFDGIHHTNGVHPAWTWALVPLFWVFDGDLAPLVAMLWLQVLLIAVGCVVLHRALAPRVGAAAAAAGVLCCIALPASTPILRAGMESALVFFVFCMLQRSWVRAFPVAATAPGITSAGRTLGVGVWIAALFLCRIEAILALPIAMLLARRRLGRSLPSWAALVLPATLTFLAYVAWNRLSFGTWLTVSGMVKSDLLSRMPLGFRLGLLTDLPWVGQSVVLRAFHQPSPLGLPLLGKLVLALVDLAAIVAAYRHRAWLRRTVSDARVGLVLVTCLAMALVDRAAVVRLFPWYQVPFLLATGIVTALILAAFPRVVRAVTPLLAVACLLHIAMDLHAISRVEERASYFRIRAADWMRAELPEDARIGSWNAGLFGYYSHRHVVNLDGLVNDVEYYRLLASRQPLDDYLERERIDWLADFECGSNGPERYLRLSGSGHLASQFEVVASFQPPGTSCPGIVVWGRTGSSK